MGARGTCLICFIVNPPLEMRELYSDVNDRIYCCSYGDHSHAISDSSVDDAIKKLKLGKSDGYDGLTSDYINNGTSLLTHYLSLLFSLMLSHCYTPTSFCVSTMILIPNKMHARRCA